LCNSANFHPEVTRIIGQAALFAAAGLDLETIEKIDDIVEPALRAVADQSARNCDGQL